MSFPDTKLVALDQVRDIPHPDDIPAPVELPPIANLDAEEMVLGSLLLSGLTSKEASGALAARTKATGLDANDFYRPAHGRIFRACIALTERDEPIEPLAVVDELRVRGELSEISGGSERIHELAALSPAMSNAPFHADRIKDAAFRRRQERIAKQLLRDAREGGVQHNDELRQQLQTLLEPRRGVGLTGIDLAEMLSSPVPPIDWLCESLIERGTLNLVVADGYVGKSLLALDLLLALRKGEPFLGFPTKQSRCGYVDLENSDREIHRRLVKFGLAADDVDGLWMSKDRLNLASAEGITRLRATIEENRLDVIVIDSFRRSAPGLNENDSAEVSGLFDPLLDLRDSLGVTLIVLHHVRKANDAKPSDAAQMIRGSGDFRNAVDGMLFLRASKEDKNEIVVEQSKQRSGSPIDPFVVRRLNDDDGRVRHIHDGPADVKSLGADQELLGRIIKTLRESRDSVVSRTNLAGRLGVGYGSGTYARALELGFSSDQLSRTQDAKNKPLFVGLGPASFDLTGIDA